MDPGFEGSSGTGEARPRPGRWEEARGGSRGWSRPGTGPPWRDVSHSLLKSMPLILTVARAQAFQGLRYWV